MGPDSRTVLLIVTVFVLGSRRDRPHLHRIHLPRRRHDRPLGIPTGSSARGARTCGLVESVLEVRPALCYFSRLRKET